MIDTVRYYFDPELTLKPGVDFRRGMKSLDASSKLRAWFSETGITCVEVSLPRLLFPNNSYLIKNQDQLDEALAKADKILAKFANVRERQSRIFKRVDLAWNFAERPERMFVAHEHCNHPEVRKKVAVYRNSKRQTGISWIGIDMRIEMYDKSNWKLKCPRAITRVEIQLRGRKLKDKLGGGKPVQKLVFAPCYSEYRKVLVRFKPKDVLIPSAKDDAIILAEFRYPDLKLIDLLRSKMSEKSIDNLERRRRNWVWKHFQIDWDKLLPANSPPFPWKADNVAPAVRFHFKKTARH